MVSCAWFDLEERGVVLPTRRRDLLCLRVGFPHELTPCMSNKERHLGREYLQKQLVSSVQLELLIDALYEAAKMDTSYTGYVSALTTTGEDLLVVQELELHVLMRLTYVAANRTPGPDIEIVSYIDRHGAYYPLLLRGQQVGRAAQTASQPALTAFVEYLGQYFLTTGWPARGIPIDPVHRAKLLQPELYVTTDERGRIAGWLAAQGLCEATDGCDVQLYDHCPHGCYSWPAELGLI